MTSRDLKLGLFFFATGYHPAGWRLSEARADGTFDVDFIIDVAQRLEAAKFDFFFLGDTLSTPARQQYQRPSQIIRFEPFTLLSALALHTRQIGFVVTANTSYAEPFQLARMTASLDHLSRGRLAWNVVTGLYPDNVSAFGAGHEPSTDERYDRADEFIRVVRQLWDSWDDGVYVRNKATGEFIDEARVHPVRHRERYFDIRGPLNVLRPPQGQIPLLHAGRTGRSWDFAATYADVLFSMSTRIEEALRYRTGIEARRAHLGRGERDVKILPGLIPIVGKTTAAARAQYEALNVLLVGDGDLSPLSSALGCDLRGHPLDTPIGTVLRGTVLSETAEDILFQTRAVSGREAPTIRDVLNYFNATKHSRFLVVVGSVTDVADTIERWFTTRAADGFIICPAYYPGGLDEFVTGVIPELQRRGIYKTEYCGRTFREYFDLPRPENRHAPAPVGAEDRITA